MKSFLKSFLGEKGLSLTEGIIGAGMLGATALGFAELSKNSVNSAAVLEMRYTKMDVEQSIRTAFIDSDSCRCAFTGKNIVANNVTNLSELKFMDASCGNPRPIITSGEVVQNSTLKVEDILVGNVTSFGASEVVGDLIVKWKAPNKGLPMKSSILRNLRFNVDATGAVLGCGFVPESSLPTPCGNGIVCFKGKPATFTNAVGAPLTVVIVGADTSGMILWFQTPAGRTTMLKFSESGGVLSASRLGSWRPQFCYGHQPNMPYCAQMNYWGSNGQPNCAAPVYWTYNGNSGNSTTLTSGTVVGSFSPTRYADGTWPFKDTSTLPCGF